MNEYSYTFTDTLTCRAQGQIYFSKNMSSKWQQRLGNEWQQLVIKCLKYYVTGKF